MVGDLIQFCHKFKSFLAPELEPEFFSTEGAGAGANDNLDRSKLFWVSM